MIAQQKVDRMTEGLIDKINAARHERGLSVKDVSAISGISLQGLYHILRGEDRNPTLETLIRIMEPLGLCLTASSVNEESTSK